MQSIKIKFSTNSNRGFGEDTPLGCLLFIFYCISILIIIFNGETAERVIGWFSERVLGVEDDTKSYLEKNAIIFGAIGALSIWYLAFRKWLNVFIKCFSYLLIEPIKKKMLFSFFQGKIRDDISNCSLGSAGEIKNSIKNVVSDSENLKIVINDEENIWLDNAEIWPINTEHFQTEIYEAIKENFTSADRKIIERYNEQIKIVQQKSGKLKNKEKIRFYVAAVQPAFLLACNKVIKDAKIYDKVLSDSPTSAGPETVEHCIDLKLRMLENDFDAQELILFVAPLSAFITAQIQDKNSEKFIDPRLHFQPVISLTKETQNIFYLEGGSSAPTNERRLFYLNNSTAEECVANLSKHLSRFIPQRISTYEEYKYLLHGKKIKGDLELQPGDGIVLWTPLSKYFDLSTVGTNHIASIINKNLNVELKNQTYSRIILFGDSEYQSVSPELTDFYKSFILAFSLNLIVTHKKLLIKDWSRFKGLIGSPIGNLNDTYKIFIREYQSDFIKLFK